jgi:two-component system phosphate regulon sensor histidine kinase PhoR
LEPRRPSIFRSRFFWNLYLTYALLVVATAAVIAVVIDRPMAHTVGIASATAIGVFGALVLAVVAGRRITAPIYQEQAQLRSMVAGIPVGLVAVDGVDRVLFANNAACEMLGQDTLLIVGEKLSNLVKGSALPDLARDARRDDASNMEAEFTISRGGEMVISAHAVRFEGGGPSSVVVVLEDVTSLKRLERIRRDFVANVSHEIKTPLTSIKGYVETLITGALYDEQNNMRFLRKIDDHVGRLTNLVQDLLSLARIEAQEGSLRLAETDWRPIVEGAVRRHEPELQSRGLTFAMELEPESVVFGESESMTQILDNLLDNAIKYTPAGSVRVKLFRLGSQVSLQVEDSGLGIPPEDRERIFERFYRVDKARSREMGGTGLGLSIVKHLAQAMHGEVRLVSEVGKGSQFTVTLPSARV